MRIRLVLLAMLAVAAPAHASPPVGEVVRDVMTQLGVDPQTRNDLCYERDKPRDDVVAHAVCAPVGQVHGEVTWPFPEPPPL